MAIISTVGRSSARVSLLILIIYLILISGAATMIYPFLLMVAGSTKSGADETDAVIIPRFLYNEQALWAKHFEGLVNESLQVGWQAYANNRLTFATLPIPRDINHELVRTWVAFLEESNPSHEAYSLGYLHVPRSSRGVIPHTLRAFKNELSRQFNGDLHRLNMSFGTEFLDWYNFQMPPENHLVRGLYQEATPLISALREFKERQEHDVRYYHSLDGFYRTFLENQYAQDIDAYNEANHTDYSSFQQIHLARRADDLNNPADWARFVRSVLKPIWVTASPDVVPLYRTFLRARYATIQSLSTQHQTLYADFEQIVLPEPGHDEGPVSLDWADFVQGWTDPDTGTMHILPTHMIEIDSVEFRFRDYLRQRFDTIESVNRGLNTDYDDWPDIKPPQLQAHYLWFNESKGWLRWEFLTRNYVTVVDYMVLHGYGVLNTAIYCAMTVLLALLVNPLAAYALSRYRPPSTYKLLLLMMLTMSFPPMVTQIPVFLMLRELGMLNTYWALVLPGMASGYSIFLLKGFFDSLPSELYESAEIDGAGELRIFWQITMSLSKPVLAVIALSAFTAAYSNFMFALLICQDQGMWTLMVWLYQLQQRSGPGVIYASLMVAAVPTFLIFAFCQRIIMRGIVVPVEK